MLMVTPVDGGKGLVLHRRQQESPSNIRPRSVLLKFPVSFFPLSISSRLHCCKLDGSEMVVLTQYSPLPTRLIIAMLA